MRHVYFDAEWLSNSFRPQCATLVEPITGFAHTYWADEHPQCPFPRDQTTVWHFFYGSGDMQWMRTVGWGNPILSVDHYVEYALITNHGYPRRLNLLSAAEHYGIPAMTHREKEASRGQFLQGAEIRGSDNRERAEKYSLADGLLTAAVGQKIMAEPSFSLPYALNRGQEMKAISRGEELGLDIDPFYFYGVREHRLGIINDVTELFDPEHLIIDPEGHYKLQAIEKFLDECGYLSTWPRTETGQISLAGCGRKDCK